VDFVIETFGPSRGRLQLYRSGAVFVPGLIQYADNGETQEIPGFFSLRSLMGQNAVEEGNLGRHRREFASLGFIRTLGRGDQ